MKGFKDSTKTHYMQGGSCYAKGGSVKGAAKVSKVMGEFKSGTLHSGSKKGPEVTNPKQAIAIGLSEARKAGANVPVAKAEGGRAKSYSAKNAAAGKDIGKPGKNFAKIAEKAGKEYGSKAAGERVAGAILNKMRHKAEGGVVKKNVGGRVGGPDVDESGEERVPNLGNAPDDFRKRKGLEVTKTTVKAIPADAQTPLSRRLSEAPRRGPAGQTYRDTPLIGGALGAVRDAVRSVTGLKKGGLAAMPRGKKC